MSYQVLARKWRPQQFTDLVGQAHVVRSLTNALDSGRVGHAFLFSGSRGVGKTTVGRILAKGLNCETGVTAKPCGECGNCRAIEENRFVDLIEVDAASRTKVDDTRELLDNVQYLPTVGRYKVYLIDEVHMLSNHSFNALLKTLEEPPEHVKFIFATTEPARIPVTILSRCLQFELKRISADRIRERMEQILATEGMASDPEALELVARAADGSLRDGLSLLDQAINFGGGRVAGEVVREMLGAVNRDRVLALLEAVAARDGAAALDRVAEVADSGMDQDGALAELLALLHRVAVMQAVPGRAETDESLVAEERQRLEALAARTPAEDIQLFYQIGLQGRRDIATAPDPRVGLEMAVIRMVAFDPFEGGGQGGGQQGGSAGGGSARPGPQADSSGASPEDRSVPPASSAPEAPRAAAPAPPAAPEAEPSGTSGPAPASEWEGVVAGLEISPSWRSLLEYAVPREFSAETVRLAFPRDQQIFAGSQRFRSALEEALKAHFGAAPRIAVEELGADAAEESPAAARERQSREAQEAAREAVTNDPNVQILQQEFGAQVETVEPDSQGDA
jgi:DNA polymerase-3 subunit gamma/tau